MLAVKGYRHREGHVRGLIAGEWITVDGKPSTVQRDGLYRQPGRSGAIEAIRITAGVLPEWRWMRWPTVACTVIALFCLAKILVFPLNTSAPPSRTLAFVELNVPMSPPPCLHAATPLPQDADQLDLGQLISERDDLPPPARLVSYP